MTFSGETFDQDLHCFVTDSENMPGFQPRSAPSEIIQAKIVTMQHLSSPVQPKGDAINRDIFLAHAAGAGYSEAAKGKLSIQYHKSFTLLSHHFTALRVKAY